MLGLVQISALGTAPNRHDSKEERSRRGVCLHQITTFTPKKWPFWLRFLTTGITESLKMKKKINLILTALALALAPIGALAEDPTRTSATLSRAPIHNIEIGMPIADAVEILKAQGFSPGAAYGGGERPFILHVDVRPDQSRNERIGYGTRQSWSKDGVTLQIEWTGATSDGVTSRFAGEELRSFEGEGLIYKIKRHEHLAQPSSVEAVLPALQQRFNFELTNCEEPGGMPNSTIIGIHVTEDGTSDGVALLKGMRCENPINFKDVKQNAGKGYDFGALAATSLLIEVRRGADGLITSVQIDQSSPKLLMTEVDRFWAETVLAMETQGEVGSGLSDF